VLSFEYDIVALSLPVIFIIIQFVYMIMCNYFAQEITDHNNDVYVTVYGKYLDNNITYIRLLRNIATITYFIEKQICMCKNYS